MKFSNGDTFEGAFFQNKFLGYGKYSWVANGNCYDGDWVDGNLY